jgi:hypothetical protein
MSSNRSPAAHATPFVLTLWTNDAELARQADGAGVDRIGLDLETYGKAERQPRELATWISPHREDQLPALREAMHTSKLFCRINPIHPGTEDEIQRLVDHGVQVMMLPMFTTPEEVERFIGLVNGRASCVILLENLTAAQRIADICRVPGLSEVHVGINDLTLSLGNPNANRFEVLTSDLMKDIAEAVLAQGLRFGVGGIGRAMNNDQVIPGDLIYAQYPRLGATAALIARSFFTPKPGESSVNVTGEIRKARERLAWWGMQSPDALETARVKLQEKTQEATW